MLEIQATTGRGACQAVFFLSRHEICVIARARQHAILLRALSQRDTSFHVSAILRRPCFVWRNVCIISAGSLLNQPQLMFSVPAIETATDRIAESDNHVISPHTHDPADWRDPRVQGHRMLDDTFDYPECIRERPV